MQDEYVIESYKHATAAVASGKCKEDCVGVPFKSRYRRERLLRAACMLVDGRTHLLLGASHTWSRPSPAVRVCAACFCQLGAERQQLL